LGLFDIFSKSKEDRPKSGKDVARLERLVANKLSQNYDRQEAIEELSKIGSAASARALLKRFDWHLDPSITDQEEKETCLRGIVAAGESALEPLREYCKKAESLTWAIKVLKGIAPEERLTEELLSLLDQFDTEYTRNVEPKVQPLRVLEEHPSEDVRVAVEPFLTDAGETVRFTAVNTTFAVNDEKSAPSLVAALVAEESLRVKNRISERLAERDWVIPPELLDACKSALPPGFAVDSGRIVRR
jgi:HEAT repeat protein